MDVCLSSRGLGLGVVQMRVVMYIFSTYFPYCVRNVWDRRSLCGHCRVILPTYLPYRRLHQRFEGAVSDRVGEGMDWQNTEVPNTRYVGSSGLALSDPLSIGVEDTQGTDVYGKHARVGESTRRDVCAI